MPKHHRAPVLFGPSGEPLTSHAGRTCLVCQCDESNACCLPGFEADPAPCWWPFEALDVCSACLLLLGAQKLTEASGEYAEALRLQQETNARRAA